MLSLSQLYKPSLSLLTDFYQLTMAYAYFKCGVTDREAVFHLTYRKNPFGGGYSVCCGLQYVIEYLKGFAFDESDLEYLRDMRGNDGKPLFDPAYLDHLKGLEFSCDVDALPEGTVAFPHEPLVRVKGPILQCQILESALLNIVNFQTLIATKSARVCQAALGDPVLEFGLRRAQGIDGSLAASRAAYVGGCAATSNVLAGKHFGIPVKGTHAHSWVMTFETELESFEQYAAAMPNNCIFLVDTYDTLEGVRNAVEVGRTLRERGHDMMGVRLDSGDLAYLSIESRRILDEGGFPDAKIVASNDLDEGIIKSLKEQGAKIAIWGVGTKLATAYDQPAMGGVYKMSAIRQTGGDWQYKVKLSEQAIKISNPGILQVRRFLVGEEYVGDMIYDEKLGATDASTIVDPMDMTRRKVMPTNAETEDLLVPIFRGGECVYDAPSLPDVRERAMAGLSRFHSGVKRFVYPHEYPVGLEQKLFDLKTKLILRARDVGQNGGDEA